MPGNKGCIYLHISFDQHRLFFFGIWLYTHLEIMVFVDRYQLKTALWPCVPFLACISLIKAPLDVTRANVFPSTSTSDSLLMSHARRPFPCSPNSGQARTVSFPLPPTPTFTTIQFTSKWLGFFSWCRWFLWLFATLLFSYLGLRLILTIISNNAIRFCEVCIHNNFQSNIRTCLLECILL